MHWKELKAHENCLYSSLANENGVHSSYAMLHALKVKTISQKMYTISKILK